VQGRVISGLYPGGAEHKTRIHKNRKGCHEADDGQARGHQRPFRERVLCKNDIAIYRQTQPQGLRKMDCASDYRVCDAG